MSLNLQKLRYQLVIWLDFAYLVWLCFRFFMLEPQPQMQPVSPPPQLEYGEPPPRPLDLKPAPRRPLEVKPAPRQPLDLRPRPEPRPGTSATPQELLERSRSNPFSVLEPIVNNPLNYAPGKGLAGIAGTVADRVTDPNAFNPYTPFETIDVPALPLPDEFNPELPLSETTPFNPDAVDPGPLTDPGSPAIPAQIGQRATPYQVYWTCPITRVSSRYGTSTIGFPGTQGPVLLTGPLALGYTGAGYGIYHAAGFYAFGAAQPADQQIPYYDNATGTYKTEFITYTANPSFTATAVNGSPDTPAQPEVPPTREPNPARQGSPSPFPDFDPFLDPADGFMPGFQPSPQPLLEPAPTGDIVPYQPPVEDITDRLRPVNPPTGEPSWEPYRPPYSPDFPDFDPATPTERSRWKIRWPWSIPRRGSNTGDKMNPPTQQKEKTKTTPPLTRECCGDEIVRDEGRRLREALKDLADVLSNRAGCEVIADIPTWVCDDTGNGYLERKVPQTAANLSQAFNLLAEEVAAIRQKLGICDETTMQNENPSILAQDTATEGQTVWYVQLPAVVRQVELIITGQIPTAFRLYDTSSGGEQQAKFGSITLSYPGSAGGNTADAFHQWAWTRRTSLYVDKPLRETRYIRVFVRAGLSWILYDTGLRN